MSDTITLEDVVILRDTDDAYHIDYDGIKCWIPKSQVQNFDEVNAEYTNAGGGTVEIEEFIIPEWIAINKELI